MTAEGNSEQFRLGFLTAIEVSDRGYVGGLLVTNHFGRPLEFQCTAPVKPNRTQEILYGPTLVPFLLGELIGRTLVEKVTIKPHIVLTERSDLLDLRSHVKLPVAFVGEPRQAADQQVTDPNSPPVVPAGDDGTISFGRQRLRFHAAHPGDRGAVESSAAMIPQDADLREPFERVREALQETVRLGALK